MDAEGMSLPPNLLGDGLRLLLFFVLGLGGGALYFYAVWRNIRMLAHGAGMGKAIFAMFGRFALMALALGLASRGGPGPLLAAASGILLARLVVVRRLKDRTP
jgi:N-ATPase, AtpR subunit